MLPRNTLASRLRRTLLQSILYVIDQLIPAGIGNYEADLQILGILSHQTIKSRDQDGFLSAYTIMLPLLPSKPNATTFIQNQTHVSKLHFSSYEHPKPL